MRKSYVQILRGEDNFDNEFENKCDLEIGDSLFYDDVYIEEMELFIFVKEIGVIVNC